MVVCDASIDICAGSSAENPTNEEVITDADELISFRVRDFNTGLERKVCATTITTIGEFLRTIADTISISFEELDLLYQDKTTANIYKLSQLPSTNTFATINIVPSKTQVYSLTVNKKRIPKPRVYLLDDDVMDETPPEPKAEQRPTSSTSYLNDYVGKEFVGLKNQKSTCYLNSLLQSLFFCPEFRNAIYLKEFPYDPQKKSVGAALQKLFLRLQFSSRPSIETDEITKTFGWKDYDSSIQHDIEELYRIIMDVLGDEFKKSSNYSMTVSLFGGLLIDYVECTVCNKRNDRHELTLALNLPVRVYGKSLPNPSLDESVRAFLVVDTLDGNNQYDCGNCNVKVDARKAFLFEQLPYFMCLQLQRSEFDFQTMMRKKCCDKVAFPLILDMNEFVTVQSSSAELGEKKITPIDIKQIRGEKYVEKRSTHSRPNVELTNIDQGNETQSQASHRSEIERCLKNGLNVYQLLSVLIHRGSSSLAGHYYAYVLDLETNRWYQFNDASVRRISESDIAETFGDGSKNLNEDKEGIAYMLIYRRIDATLNSLPLTLEELPSEIADLWKALEIEDKETHERETYERNIMRTTVFFRQKDTWNLVKAEMILQKSDTMSDVAMKCYKEFFPHGTIETDMIRLVRFHEEMGIMDLSFDGKEMMSLGIAYRRSPDVERKDCLMLEIREPDFGFETIQPNDVVFKVHLLKSKSDSIVAIKEIHARPYDSVEDLKLRVSTILRIPLAQLKLIVRIKNSTTVLDKDEHLALTAHDLREFHELFVENVEDEEGLDQMKKYVRNHYNCFVFKIECRLNVSPPTPESAYNSASMQFSDEGSEASLVMDNFFNPANVAKKLEESLRGDGIRNKVETRPESENNERPMLGVTNSSTASEAVDLKSDLEISSDSNDFASSFGNQSKASTSCSTLSSPIISSEMGQLYFRVIGELPTGSDEVICYAVKVDKEMTLRELSKKIEHLIGIEESQFVIYKVTKNREEEILDYSTTLEFTPFESFIVKLHRRLLTDEGRVNVYLLDLEKASLGSLFLADVILNLSMSVKEAKQIIKAAIPQNIEGFNRECLESFRLRRKNFATPSQVLRDSLNLVNYFTKIEGELFLQPISTPSEEFVEHYHTMLIRHWSPSQLILSSPIELVFKYDYTIPLETILAEKICDALKMPLDQIQVAIPDGDYPYDMNPITIHEVLVWFRLDNKSDKHVSIYHDEGILFVRNINENLMVLSPEKRRILEDEALGRRRDYTLATPKRTGEVGLYVNLARTPPT